MLEIEMKFPVEEFAQVKKVLAGWQARPDGGVIEEDHYFNAPHRDFAQTDEALRIRRIGPHSQLTYKGPKHAGPTKTRTELEVPLHDGDAPAETLARLLVHPASAPPPSSASDASATSSTRAASRCTPVWTRSKPSAISWKWRSSRRPNTRSAPRL
jgi:inorganic triphosphatase YgiF